MVFSGEDPLPTATLKDILEGADSVPEFLRLKPRVRKVLVAYFDQFGIREDYERLRDVTLVTRDPTFIGFERGYGGEKPSIGGLWEENPVAIRIGYNAGQEARKQSG